jgi:CBS domain-containing protein
MQQINQIMSRDVRVVAPSATVQQAAEQMRKLDVGAMPICDGQKLIGMITDRDIAVRTVADGKDPKTTKVSDVMSSEIVWCFDDDDVQDVARVMGERQIRRIPVVDHDKKLVGIVALADLAEHGDEETKAETLEGVSEDTRARS